MTVAMPYTALQQLMLRQQAATVRWPFVANRCDQRHCQRKQAVCQAGSNGKRDLTAVVVGSGFSGLYAAAGLSSRFAQVVKPTSLTHTHAPSAYYHRNMYDSSTFVLNHTQTLLDKDDCGDAVTVEKASNPEVWREEYEVCLQHKHTH